MSKDGLTHLLAGLADTDLTALGSPRVTAILAARALVGVGFAAGLLLGAGAARRGPAFLILGAGLGAALWPAALERAAERPGPLAMQLALGGLALAAVCALPAGLVALRRGPWGARLALPLLALVTAGGWFLPREEVRPLSPWYRVEVEPLWQRDTALGLMTLEPSPAGDLLLTVDRVVLTPPADEQPGDEARLLAALDLAAANWRPGDPVLEVLLAGQLTRGRLAAFERWRRASELDARLSWTAPWLPWHAEIQRWTDRFKDLPEPIPFEEAQASMGTGRFDLVVVPQVFGTPLPALEAMDAPRAVPPAALPPGRTSTDQPAVVFVAVESPLAWADLSDQVLVAGSDLDHLALGLVSGLREGVPFAPGPRTRAPGTLERLGLRAELRPSLDRARTFERLAAESPSPLIGALAAFFDDQERSSPWARPDERLELDQGRLEALAAATEVPLVPLARTTWEHLARVLITKRMSGETFAVVPGLLERLDSFPPLEHALARSYMEMLMPTEGAALLLPLYEAGWRSPEPLMDLAWALSEQDDWARAAEVYGAVLEELPGFHHAARLRALAAMRAGLSEGPALVAEILEKDPEDEDLRRYLQPGPLPPAEPVGFDPNPLGRDTEDGHDH